MSEVKHTPLPWQIEGKFQGDTGSLYLSTMHPMPVFELRPIVGAEAKHIANAEFIARACNSHYKMLDALKRLEKATRILPPAHDEPGSPLAAARAAIDEAEGL